MGVFYLTFTTHHPPAHHHHPPTPHHPQVRLAAVTTALATKRGMTSHMFSGGCGSRQHGGWYVIVPASLLGTPMPAHCHLIRISTSSLMFRPGAALKKKQKLGSGASSYRFIRIGVGAHSNPVGTRTASTGSSSTLRGHSSSSGPTIISAPSWPDCTTCPSPACVSLD